MRAAHRSLHMEQSIIRLRPHHALCLRHFVGKGYSEEFVRNMTELYNRLNSGQRQMVQIILHRDSVCIACPHDVDFSCETEEKVRALDAGADDYLSKPIGTQELMARIRTALRHSNRLKTDSMLYNRPFHAKELTVDFEKHLVLLGNTPVHLTQIEFKIISLLARNSGRVMTYDAIISNIWGPYADSDNSILRVNMAHIRRKLEKNPAEPEYVFTEIGIGYRMVEDETV